MPPAVYVLFVLFVGILLLNIFSSTGFDFIADLAFGIIFGLGAVFFVGLAFFGIGAYTYNSSQTVESHHVPLKSMSDTQEIHGQFSGGFFVSYGEINQDAVYRFYGRNDNGTYTLATVTAGNSEVREGNYPKPYATCYWKPAKNIPKFRGWFLDMQEDVWQNANTALWCTFYIPTGTIKDDYTLDTQ